MSKARRAQRWASEWPDVQIGVLFVATCSRCGEQDDQDGAEYGATPREAESRVLHAPPTGEHWRRIDGRLVCDACATGGDDV